MAVPEQLADNFFASFECENITINIKDILIFSTKFVFFLAYLAILS
jgi:hypothetical protein